MKFLGIIPARYASTRFPAKPLAILGDKPIIQHVYEGASPAFDDIVVATDNEEIFNCVESFGGKAVMTSPHHQSGTDRCYEAYTKLGEHYDVIVNVQGDEPFINLHQIEQLKQCYLDNENTQVATLIMEISKESTYNELENPNMPKVVVDKHGKALMFSRSVIPHLRGIDKQEWASIHTFYKHIGIYAYRADVLKNISKMESTKLEKAESLEQLRWLDNGIHIQTAVTDIQTIGIDTPEDLELAKEYYYKKHI